MGIRDAVLGLAIAGLAWAPPPAIADAPGELILIGGGKRPESVMRTFVELAGGAASRIVVFPTASELDDTGEFYEQEFRERWGAPLVRALPVRERADAGRPELVAALEEATGIFFAGGDQRRITEALLGTPVGEAVVAAHRRGVPVAGTSAGLACMGARMITGDGDFEVVKSGAVELAPGLGLAPGLLLDQHFLARRRLNRLLGAVLEHPDLLGVGVDESTAIRFRPGGDLEVLGDGQVVVLDARTQEPRPSAGDDGLLGGSLRLTVLRPGERYAR